MNRRQGLTIPVVLLVRMYCGDSVVAQSPEVSAATCDAMVSLSIRDTQLITATVVAPTPTVAAHFLVVAVTHGEPGWNVGVEVRLPTEWNGKLLFTSRQGYMGSFPPVTNLIPTQALQRHYGFVATDGGHSGVSLLEASAGWLEPIRKQDI
jgi:hypothetical protein